MHDWLKMVKLEIANMLILPTDAPQGGLILSIVIQPKIWLPITFEVCLSKVVELAEGATLLKF